jgi:hypothetical protein
MRNLAGISWFQGYRKRVWKKAKSNRVRDDRCESPSSREGWVRKILQDEAPFLTTSMDYSFVPGKDACLSWLHLDAVSRHNH